MVQLLVHDADVTLSDNRGKTPLKLATELATDSPQSDELDEIIDILHNT